MFLKVVILLFVFQIFACAVDANLEVNCENFTKSEHCVKLGKKFYLIDPNVKLNWFEADRYCRRQNARLALIENDDEMDTIANYIDHYHAPVWHSFWLSATKLGSTGTFYEVESGNPLRFVRWGVGLPDNYKGPEDCLDLIWWHKNNKYIMNDDNCAFNLNFICEFKEKSSEGQSNTHLRVTVDSKDSYNHW